jgi:hypothetical protein
MSNVTIRIEVTPSKTSAYWVAIDTTPVTLTNGVGQITFDAGASAVLVWWFTGDPGASLELAISRPNGTALVSTKSTMPAGEVVHAGFKRFSP